MRSLNWFLLAVAASSVIGGCTPNHGDTTPDPSRFTNQSCGSSDYYDASCSAGKNGFDVGEDLVMIETNQIVAISFQKKFNVSAIQRVLHASPHRTIDSMAAAGVKVFQNGDKCGCAIFQSLPMADQGLEAYWKNGRSDETGFFLPADLVSQVGSDVKASVVVVRGDTDRWTLLHQYMHFLFNEQREKDGVYLKDLNQNSDFVTKDLIAMSDWVSQVSAVSVEQSAEMLLRFKADLVVLKQALGAKALEEMTIDSYLSGLYKQQDLKYVPSQSRKSAARLICQKYLEVLGRYQSLEKLVSAINQKFGLTEDNSGFSRELSDFGGLVTEARGLNRMQGLGEACVSSIF